MTDRSTVTSSTVTGSAAGVITRRTLPAPTDVTVYELTGAVRHATVDGDTEIARRALEPLAAAGAKPAPSPPSKPACI